MITAIVRFSLPEGTTLDDARTMFKGSAPNYRSVAGLVRKYYLFDPAGTAGGVYLWESRAAADRLYTDEWRQMISDKFGAPPEVSYFESPVIVDNVTNQIVADEAA